jgi:hypothetical protein
MQGLCMMIFMYYGISPSLQVCPLHLIDIEVSSILGLTSPPIRLSMLWPYYNQLSRIKHLWVRSSCISELVVVLMLVSFSRLTILEDVVSKHLLKKGCACAKCRELSYQVTKDPEILFKNGYVCSIGYWFICFMSCQL